MWNHFRVRRDSGTMPKVGADRLRTTLFLFAGFARLPTCNLPRPFALRILAEPRRHELSHRTGCACRAYTSPQGQDPHPPRPNLTSRTVDSRVLPRYAALTKPSLSS